MSRMVQSAWCGALVALLAPTVVAAQEETTPPPQQAEQTELVFEREVFQYPQFQRRNPFHPLDSGDEGQVRFEQLRVSGIIVGADPLESVVTLTTSELTVSEDGSGVSVSEGQSWYAKVGQTVGNVRILEIHADRVVVEIEEFGIAEQRIMQLETRRLGGTP